MASSDDAAAVKKTPGEVVAERLHDVARRRLGGTAAEGVTRLTAGATQEIWRFDLIRNGGQTPLILRRSRGGGEQVSATSINLESEAGLLQLVGAVGVPVPVVKHVLEPDDGLGHGFIMSFVEGETLGGRIVRAPELADARGGMARQCGQILAQIHSVDPAKVPSLKVSTPADLVDQWRTGYLNSDWPRPVFDLAFRWLDDHCPPPPASPRLVHGDFRNGNLMIGPDGVRAVLDWELAHVGDPMEDLGWICVNPWRFGVTEKPVGGFGDREDLFAGYDAAGGAPVDKTQVKFWEVYGSMRWGVMCAGMTAAFRAGDPSVERAVIARRASENEVDLMRLLDHDR